MTLSSYHIVSTRNNRGLQKNASDRFSIKNKIFGVKRVGLWGTRNDISDHKTDAERTIIRRKLKAAQLKDRIVAGALVLFMIVMAAGAIYMITS